MYNFFFYKLEWINMVQFKNQFKSYDGFNNVFVHDKLGFFFGSGTSLPWIMGESARPLPQHIAWLKHKNKNLIKRILVW